MRKSGARLAVVLLAVAAGCGARPAAGGAGTATPSYLDYDYVPAPAAAPASAPASDPTRQRAAAYREASELLDQAAAARAAGDKSKAEVLFSSAEMALGDAGPAALADLAAGYREGAPPRVVTPLKPVAKDAAPQPAVVGSSERDRPEPRPKKGALAGAVLINGRAPSGELGVVTLEPKDGKFPPPLPVPRVVEQRNRAFAPHLLVVPVGSIVTFPNFDAVYHNVFSRSPAKMFDLGLYKNAEAREVVFEREGIVRLGCNLHANMSAWVVVVNAPHYTVTDGTGHFAFGSLEPGTYLLKAWSERSAAPITQVVEIKAGKNNVSVGVAADMPSGPQPDKFGEPRAAKSP